jgi:hypothetical protein
MKLVCFQGQGNLNQLDVLIKKGEWDGVTIIRGVASEKQDFEKGCEVIEVDCAKSLIDLREDLGKNLKEKLGKEFEVGLSIASGNGKEHMALISALLSVPVGIKFVAFTKKGVEFIS